jgi:polar amino acid transport system substrate-binding protein
MITDTAVRSAAGLCALLLLAASAFAGDSAPCQALTPAGKLRAALYPGTPTSILDPNGSAPRGVGYELGKELARMVGVPYQPVVYPKNAEVIEAIRTGAADVAFTNASPTRQKEMNFGPFFLIIELGYLVPASSGATSSSELDKAGTRIGVTVGSTSESTLSRDLRNAEVVRVATNNSGAELLAAGKLDAFATNKATLFDLADKTPGTKVLPDRWGEERHAIAFPHGREQAASCIRRFTEDAIAQGLVRSAMERAHLRGAQVADIK